MDNEDFTIKSCSQCGILKPNTTEYYSKKNKNSGDLVKHCKECAKVSRQIYYQKNKDRIKASSNEYYKNNLESSKSRAISYYYLNKEVVKNRIRKYLEDNKDKVKVARAKSYKENKDAVKIAASKYYKSNKDKIQKSQFNWRNKNKDKVRLYSKNYLIKIKSDQLLSMKQRYRSFVSKIFRSNGFTKKSKAQEILGCSWNDFKLHIERQFINGMSWNRISEIHLDHIVPLSSAKNENDLISLNHYTNLRPLWAKDNLSKGSKMECLI